MGKEREGGGGGRGEGTACSLRSSSLRVLTLLPGLCGKGLENWKPGTQNSWQLETPSLSQLILSGYSREPEWDSPKAEATLSSLIIFFNT